MGNKTRTIILIAPEFDEEIVVQCLYQMRQRGTAVDLVGTPTHLVIGASGLMVHPDYSLAQLHQTAEYDQQLIVIPGSTACATNLLSDPRVHQVIQKSLKSGGYVATSSPVVPQILTNIGLLAPKTAPQFLFKGRLSTGEFIQKLISCLPT